MKNRTLLAVALLASALAGCGGEGVDPGPGLHTQIAAFQEMRHGLAPATIILTYHDVIERRDGGALWFDCTTDELKRQLAWMKAHGAHFVRLSDVYRHLTTGLPLPAHAVAITFADNYLGFFQRAYPVLRRLQVPCTMFVHTGFIGSPVGRPKMNWEQLLKLDREGLVEIASQTVTHAADLKKLSSVQLQREMAESKRTLEMGLGHEVDKVAYPNGKFDHRAEAAAKSAGYRMAFSEVQSPAERSPSILAVNRYVHTKWQQAWRDSGKIGR